MKKFFEFLVEDMPENKEAPVRITHTRPTFKLNPDVAMRNLRKDFEDKLDTDKPATGKKITPGKDAGGRLGFADMRSDQRERPQPNRKYDRKIQKFSDEIFGEGGDGYQWNPETSSETRHQYGQNKFNQLKRLSGLVGGSAGDADHIDKLKNIIGTSNGSSSTYNLNDKILDVIENGKFDLSNDNHIEFLKKYVHDKSEDDQYDGDLQSLSKLDFSNAGVNSVMPGLSSLLDKFGDTEGYGDLIGRGDVQKMIENLTDNEEKGIDRKSLRQRLDWYQRYTDRFDMFKDDPEDGVENIHDIIMGAMNGSFDMKEKTIKDIFNGDDAWDVLNSEDSQATLSDGDDYNYASSLLQSISIEFNNGDKLLPVLSSFLNTIGEDGSKVQQQDDVLDKLGDIMEPSDFMRLLKQDAMDQWEYYKDDVNTGSADLGDNVAYDFEDWWKNQFDDYWEDTDIDTSDILGNYYDMDYDEQQELDEYINQGHYKNFEELLTSANNWIEENRNIEEFESREGTHVSFNFRDNSKWDKDLDIDTISNIQDVLDELGINARFRRYIEWTEDIDEDVILDKWKERFGSRPHLDRKGEIRPEMESFAKQIAVFDALKTWREELKEMSPGTILQNSPMRGGAGDNMREVLYNKMGFGRVIDDGQFGVVGTDGKVHPVNDFTQEEKDQLAAERQDERRDRDKNVGMKANIGRKARKIDDKFREKFPQLDEPTAKILDAKNKRKDDANAPAIQWAKDNGLTYKGFGYWKNTSGEVYRIENGEIFRGDTKVYPTDKGSLNDRLKSITMNKKNRSNSND